VTDAGHALLGHPGRKQVALGRAHGASSEFAASRRARTQTMTGTPRTPAQDAHQS
jgi:hypothetical protein